MGAFDWNLHNGDGHLMGEKFSTAVVEYWEVFRDFLMNLDDVRWDKRGSNAVFEYLGVFRSFLNEYRRHLSVKFTTIKEIWCLKPPY